LTYHPNSGSFVSHAGRKSCRPPADKKSFLLEKKGKKTQSQRWVLIEVTRAIHAGLMGTKEK
jgi:hypothetical protein